MFGRDRAKEIAEPLLMVLFVMTADDYKKALEVIGKIESFPVKRIFLEQFKYCFGRSDNYKNRVKSSILIGAIFSIP